MQVNDKPLLDTYKAAVRSNVQFRSFDHEAMRDSSSRVLRSFHHVPGTFPHLEPTNGSRSHENQSPILSFETLKAFTEFTLLMCRVVTEIILKSFREDTWNNDALFLLANENLDIIIAQLKFYGAAEDSIKRARDDAQSFLETALKSVPVDMERADAYRRMFLEAEEPFGKEFGEKLRGVWERHELMWKTLKAQEKELEKKLQRDQVLEVLVVALLAAVVIGSTVAAAVAAPPVAAAVVGSISGFVPLAANPIVTWLQSLWENRRQEIEEQLERVRNGTRADTVDVSAVHEIQCIKRRFAAIVSMHGNNIRTEKDQFVSKLDDLHEHIQKIKKETKRESQRIIDMLANCGETSAEI